jgi:hypothetical protein
MIKTEHNKTLGLRGMTTRIVVSIGSIVQLSRTVPGCLVVCGPAAMRFRNSTAEIDEGCGTLGIAIISNVVGSNLLGSNPAAQPPSS